MDLRVSDGAIEPFFTRPISMAPATATIFTLLLYIPAFKSAVGPIGRQFRRVLPRRAAKVG